MVRLRSSVGCRGLCVGKGKARVEIEKSDLVLISTLFFDTSIDNSQHCSSTPSTGPSLQYYGLGPRWTDGCRDVLNSYAENIDSDSLLYFRFFSADHTQHTVCSVKYLVVCPKPSTMRLDAVESQRNEGSVVE